MWSEYLPTRRRLTDRFAALGKREWTRNLYWGWLWVLQSIAEPPQDARLPALFRTDAWRDKSLQTALASWAQLRRDTILYAKQSVVAAEGGDVEPEPEPRYHFVEPNTEAWSRLLELIRLTLKIPFVAGAVREELSRLEALTAFLLACAQATRQSQPDQGGTRAAPLHRRGDGYARRQCRGRREGVGMVRNRASRRSADGVHRRCAYRH